MRKISRLALTTPVLAAGLLAAAPAGAVGPSPMPRPSIGGIQQVYCPQSGSVTVTAAAPNGQNPVRIGDTVRLVVTVSPVNCDLVNTTVDMALGGGLKGDGLHEVGFLFSRTHSFSFVFGAQAVQAGTWTYDVQLLGYSFGTTQPPAGMPCSAGTALATPGYTCERTAQATLKITVTGPASPSPHASSGGSGSGSSGDSSSQNGGAGATGVQVTTADQPVPSASPESNGVVRAVGGVSGRNPWLLAGLALLVVSVVVLVALLVRRAIARPGARSPG